MCYEVEFGNWWSCKAFLTGPAGSQFWQVVKGHRCPSSLPAGHPSPPPPATPYHLKTSFQENHGEAALDTRAWSGNSAWEKHSTRGRRPEAAQLTGTQQTTTSSEPQCLIYKSRRPLTGQWLRKYIYSHTAEGTVTVVILARGPSPFLLVLAWLRNMHLETTFPSLPCSSIWPCDHAVAKGTWAEG